MDISLGNRMIRGILQQYQRDPYALKASQNHSITRLISARLKEQDLNAGPEPAHCALRCDRRVIDRRIRGVSLGLVAL
jgi:hypothetical protein